MTQRATALAEANDAAQQKMAVIAEIPDASERGAQYRELDSVLRNYGATGLNRTFWAARHEAAHEDIEKKGYAFSFIALLAGVGFAVTGGALLPVVLGGIVGGALALKTAFNFLTKKGRQKRQEKLDKKAAAEVMEEFDLEADEVVPAMALSWTCHEIREQIGTERAVTRQNENMQQLLSGLTTVEDFRAASGQAVVRSDDFSVLQEKAPQAPTACAPRNGKHRL
jgi:hypothetical protein